MYKYVIKNPNNNYFKLKVSLKVLKVSLRVFKTVEVSLRVFNERTNDRYNER